MLLPLRGSVSCSKDLSRRLFPALSSVPGRRCISIPGQSSPATRTAHSSTGQVGLSAHSSVSVEAGPAHAQFEAGEEIGPDGRYIVVRKLGGGQSSTVWLAKEKLGHKYVAIKALADRFHEHSLYWELDAFTCLSTPQPGSPFCLRLLGHFLVSAGSASKHLCLVTDLLGGDVNDLRRANDGHLPLALYKRILRHTLRGIEYAHRCGVIHTDLKWDNVFLDGPIAADATSIENLLSPSQQPTDHPPHRPPTNGLARTEIPLPLLIPSVEDAMRRTFILADFGYAWPTGEHNGHNITAIGLRAPETFLQGPWNEKVDIWTFGCLAYELIVNRVLFLPIPSLKLGLNKVEFMLYQMTCFTNDDYEPKQLAPAKLAQKYFNYDCDLRNLKGKLCYLPMTVQLRDYGEGWIQNEDIPAIAAFLTRCLRIDADDRSGASELLDDPFLCDVEA